MKNTIIFDLDGTLALIDKRRNLSRKPNGKIDFKILHDPINIKFDKPNKPVVKMAQLFAEQEFKIVIFCDFYNLVHITWLSCPMHQNNGLGLRGYF